jgi:(S)-mandelate dehydrogenase
VPYTLSTTAAASIERIAREAPGRLWFQAYALRDRDRFHALIDRARAADYEALMITVDLPVGGKRERDWHNQFSVPFRPGLKTMLDFAVHPRWLARMARHGMPVLENLVGLAAARPSLVAATSSVGRNHDPGFDWARLAQVRDRWPRRLIVKGVLHPADADRLVTMGCDAIVVSNHGGRQLDGAPASLDALPEVVRAVQGRVPVFVDGGVQRGTDLVRARALGAQAVLVGRATLYGACAAGEAGAARALAILQDELVLTMQLCGICTVQGIDGRVLHPGSAGTTPADSAVTSS